MIYLSKCTCTSNYTRGSIFQLYFNLWFLLLFRKINNRTGLLSKVIEVRNTLTTWVPEDWDIWTDYEEIECFGSPLARASVLIHFLQSSFHVDCVTVSVHNLSAVCTFFCTCWLRQCLKVVSTTFCTWLCQCLASVSTNEVYLYIYGHYIIDTLKCLSAGPDKSLYQFLYMYALVIVIFRKSHFPIIG